MRARNKLTVRQVATASKPGMLSDGGGLYLRIRPTTTKSWVFVSNVGGKRREWGLGSALDVSLATARARAEEYRQHIVDGQLPQGPRQRHKTLATEVATFGDFADTAIAEIQKGLSNPKHAKQWRSTIDTYAAQILATPIDEVSTEQILNILRPIWTSKAETAKRVRGRIERLLNMAQVQGLRSEENPARFKGHLELLLPRQAKGAVRHHKALAYRDLPEFMANLRSRTGSAAAALEFLILTAGRTGEVLGAEHSEIDGTASL